MLGMVIESIRNVKGELHVELPNSFACKHSTFAHEPRTQPGKANVGTTLSAKVNIEIIRLQPVPARQSYGFDHSKRIQDKLMVRVYTLRWMTRTTFLHGPYGDARCHFLLRVGVGSDSKRSVKPPARRCRCRGLLAALPPLPSLAGPPPSSQALLPAPPHSWPLSPPAAPSPAGSSSTRSPAAGARRDTQPIGRQR